MSFRSITVLLTSKLLQQPCLASIYNFYESVLFSRTFAHLYNHRICFHLRPRLLAGQQLQSAQWPEATPFGLTLDWHVNILNHQCVWWQQQTNKQTTENYNYSDNDDDSDKFEDNDDNNKDNHDGHDHNNPRINKITTRIRMRKIKGTIN